MQSLPFAHLSRENICNATTQASSTIAPSQTQSASWHFDTEFALWELIQGDHDAWMRLSENDPRIAELHSLHEATRSWWRLNDDPDNGWGAKPEMEGVASFLNRKKP